MKTPAVSEPLFELENYYDKSETTMNHKIMKLFVQQLPIQNRQRQASSNGLLAIN